MYTIHQTASKWRLAVALSVAAASMLTACSADPDPAAQAKKPETASAIITLQQGKPEERERAIALLAKTDDPAVVQPLITIARTDTQRHLRLAALRALQRPQLVTNGESLIDLLSDPEPQIRAVACETIAKLKVTKAEDALAERLTDSQSIVRIAAIQALSQLGPSALARVEPLMEKGKIEDRLAAIQMIGTVGEGGTEAGVARVPKLLPLLKDNNDSIRRAAAETLGKLRDERAVPALVALIKDPLGAESQKEYEERQKGPISSADRFAMVRELDEYLVSLGQAPKGPEGHGWVMSGDTSGHRAQLAKVIARQRADAEQSLRSVACDALRAINTPAATSALTELLGDENAGVGSAVAKSLKSQAGSNDALIALAADAQRSGTARLRALNVLLSDERAPDQSIENEKILKAFSGETDDTVIRTGPGSGDVIRVLPLSELVRTLLVNLLRDPDVQLRYRAAAELAVRKHPAALDPLLALLTENPPGLRAGIVRALNNYSDSRMVPPLLAALKAENDAKARTSIINALGAARDKTAVAALLPIASDFSDANQVAAVRALGTVGDPSAGKPLHALYTETEKRIAAETAKPNPTRGRGSPLEGLNALRRSIVEALGLCRYRDAAPDLLALASQTGKSDLDEVAYLALARIGEPKAVDIIAKRLTKGPYRTKAERNANFTAQACVESLVILNDARAVPALEQIVRTPPDGNAFDLSAAALGKIKQPASVDALIRLLVDPAIDRGLKETSIAPALAAHGAAAGPQLAKLMLESPEPAQGVSFDPGIYAAQLLAAIGPEVLPDIERAADTPKLYIIARVIEAAGRIADDRAVNILAKLLKNSDDRVRQWVVVALGRSRQSSAVPVLKGALSDQNADVVRWTKWALEQHGVKS